MLEYHRRDLEISGKESRVSNERHQHQKSSLTPNSLTIRVCTICGSFSEGPTRSHALKRGVVRDLPGAPSDGTDKEAKEGIEASVPPRSGLLFWLPNLRLEPWAPVQLVSPVFFSWTLLPLISKLPPPKKVRIEKVCDGLCRGRNEWTDTQVAGNLRLLPHSGPLLCRTGQTFKLNGESKRVFGSLRVLYFFRALIEVSRSPHEGTS